MPIGFLTDGKREPSPAQIARVLGPARALWKELTQHIAETYDAPGELDFGGRGYGWGVRYRRGKRALATLYPQDGHFVALVVIGAGELAAARALPLGPKAKGALRRATARRDGHWLYLPVRSPDDVRDVQQLLTAKRRPARAKAAGGASDFDAVAAQLTAILARCAKGSLTAKSDERMGYTLTGPASEASRGRDVWFGAVRKGKAYVSYHLMPVYACPELLATLSPELRKQMQGKSCFNFKRADPALFKELARLTDAGYRKFKQLKLIK